DRWALPLPSRAETVDYLQRVRDRVLDQLQTGDVTAEDVYFNCLAVFHEDMHTEAFTYTRQTLGYPAPQLSLSRSTGRVEGISGSAVLERRRSSQGADAAQARHSGKVREPSLSPRSAPSGSGTETRGGPLPGDAAVPGGVWMLGATPDLPFVFD